MGCDINAYEDLLAVEVFERVHALKIAIPV
jgi:hypothetical protein